MLCNVMLCLTATEEEGRERRKYQERQRQEAETIDELPLATIYFTTIHSCPFVSIQEMGFPRSEDGRLWRVQQERLPAQP